MRNGIRLAVDEINGIGGVGGRKIALIERDDKADNATGARIADEFVHDGVVAAIGIVNTGVGLASIDAYQKARIPLMIAVATGTSLTHKYAPPAAPQNYIFRVSQTLDLEARVLAADLREHHLASAAILADSTAYGDAGLTAFKRECESAGLRLASVERFNIGDRDMSAQVRRARESGADALIVWGIGPELAVIARNKQALGWKVPMMGSWTLSMRNFIEQAGPAAEGALMPQTFVQDVGSVSKNGFLLAYNRAFKVSEIPSPMSAAQGYDGMHLLFLALLEAGSLDGTRIAQTLENLHNHYDGALTSYDKPFSRTDHDAITQNMLLMAKVSQGRVDYASAEDRRRGALILVKKR